jgi:AraC family transcriptional regulator of adaptative response / DNA-3-methyladenine glycosylase II
MSEKRQSGTGRGAISGVMLLDPDVCYRALASRDARFDGRFFTAVRSTGVYCRPVCPARTPRRENCLFLPCAAAAQEAGYRPCLRCRPEASPGTPAWLGTSATVSRALRLIGDGALDTAGVDDLAERLGIGSRHLRRLFLEHLGATPVSVAQTRRVLFAKKLIDETSLPMAQVAYAAGFSSVRRFNDALRRTYGRPPRELRRRSAPDSDAERGLVLHLSYRPPYPWRAVLAYLSARATRGVEQVDGDTYRRSFRLADSAGWLEVRHVPERHELRATIHHGGALMLIRLAQRLRAIFDLEADPEQIARGLDRDPDLHRTLRRLPGVRLPGAWDGFELAVRTILGQQVTVAGATTLAGRLAESFGEKLPADADPASDGPALLFPTPESLAEADLRSIGLTGARERAIRALAEAVASGRVCLDPSSDPGSAIAGLRELPGIGPWTAEYVAMRALREPDAFPATDLGLRRALGLSAKALAERAEAWRPWRSYAAMLLWQTGGTGG